MHQYLKIIRDNIKSVITGDYEEGVTDLNTLSNLALLRIDRKTVTPAVKGVPRLSKEQKRAVKEFYRPYVRHMTDRYHRIYTSMSGGRFYPEYIPEELYVMLIDRYFSDREESRYIDNKCYYYRLFSNVKQPELVAMRIGQSWLDSQMKLIQPKEVIGLVAKEPEVVLKRAVNSQGGFGVKFLQGEEIAKDFCREIVQMHCDVVIQRPVKQHPFLSRLHPESVNSFRIVSLMTKNEVKICATCLKIGVGNSRVDNGCGGGLYCGVTEDGRLGEFGALDDGGICYRHPDLLYPIAGQELPDLETAYQLVREAHAFMGHFRMISWDVAIDEQGEAVLIEANLSLGGIYNVQVCNGPLFGKDTKKVLDEVFRHHRRKWTSLF